MIEYIVGIVLILMVMYGAYSFYKDAFKGKEIKLEDNESDNDNNPDRHQQRINKNKFHRKNNNG